MSIEKIFCQALQANSLTITAHAQHALLHYLDLLQTWNRVYNLTTLIQHEDMIYLHLIDSLIIHPYLYGQRFLDVGSGAGLPGLPLAIINPHQQWVLLDKNSKKTRFLTQVVAELRLPQVEIVHSRSEDFHPSLCFDSILSRAFGTLRLFTESTAHLLCQNGLYIAMKGKYPHDELKELPGRFRVEVTRLTIRGKNVERHIVRLT